jgi:hypothetical protein
MTIQHFILFQDLEFVIVNESKAYFVNREQRQLENIHDPDDILPEVERQTGCLPDGGLEVLERYCADDDEKAVVIDASPSWLAELAA